ncbi:MAG TPA: hypothetical protein VF271_10060 [Rhodanobacteraceae bacterium]
MNTPVRPVSDLERYNQALARQIADRLRQGLESQLADDAHCVVKSGFADVLSILGAAHAGDRHEILHGPASFADCLAYVNTHLEGCVTAAAKSLRDGAKPVATPSGSQHGENP